MLSALLTWLGRVSVKDGVGLEWPPAGADTAVPQSTASALPAKSADKKFMV